LENACVVTMLAAFTQQLTLVAQASSLFTTLKWSFLLITIALMLVGWAGLIASSVKSRSH
jgi:hypothetical protein